MSAEEFQSIQWDGTVDSAKAVYTFIGKPFEPIWAMQSIVDGQPVFDPLWGSPILHIPAIEKDLWMQRGDWLVKRQGADFNLVHSVSRESISPVAERP